MSIITAELVQRGLFSCSPLNPSLTVDIRVLEFVPRLNLRISPTALPGAALFTTFCNARCACIYSCSIGNSFNLFISLGSPRSQFRSALKWFNILQLEARTR
ncbi:hypothetical protein F5877DRAFT_53921 [Lentinula edodes]|nr:hypothetical protein F5877DRAFT_53921 [Lentinula edodes]